MRYVMRASDMQTSRKQSQKYRHQSSMFTHLVSYYLVSSRYDNIHVIHM